MGFVAGAEDALNFPAGFDECIFSLCLIFLVFLVSCISCISIVFLFLPLSLSAYKFPSSLSLSTIANEIWQS